MKENSRLNSNIKRIAISFFISLVGLGSTYYYFLKYYPTLKFHIDEQPVAKVENLENISRKKLSKHRTWQVIEFGDSLYSGETIKTSSDSDLVIRFLDSNAVLNLEADSLITIRKTNNEISLNLMEGHLFVDSSENKSATNISLESKDGQINLTKASVSLSKNKDSGLNVNVISGKASVLMKNGETKNIVNQDKEFIILEPKNSSVLESTKPEIKLSWLGDSKMTAGNYTFKVGTKRSDLVEVKPLRFSSSEVLLPAKFGKNFVQVEIKKTDLAKVKIAWVRLELRPVIEPILKTEAMVVPEKSLEKPKPELQWQLDREETQSYIKNPEIDLKWNLSNKELVKNLVISLSENDTVVFTETVSSELTSFKAKLQKPGRYVASVEAVDDLQKSLTKTKPKLVISEELAHLPPVIWNDKAISEKANLNGSFQTQWIALKGANNYKLLLKNSEGKIVKEWVQKKNFVKIDGLLPGLYTLQLAGIDQFERISPNLSLKKIEVDNNSEIMAPKLKKMRFK